MPISGNEVKISVRVYPNSTTNEVVGFADRVLQVRIAAPPIKGKANKKLIAFLSQILDIGKSKVCIIKGHNVRNKVITIADLSLQEITERLTTSSKL